MAKLEVGVGGWGGGGGGGGGGGAAIPLQLSREGASNIWDLDISQGCKWGRGGHMGIMFLRQLWWSSLLDMGHWSFLCNQKNLRERH